MKSFIDRLRRITRTAGSTTIRDRDHRHGRASADDEILGHLNLLMQSHTALLKAVADQLEHERPSRLAWAQAWFVLVLSAILLSTSAIWTVHISAISNEAIALHERANADRTQALQGILPFEDVGALGNAAEIRQYLADPIRLRLLIHEAGIGNHLQDLADKLDAEADQYEESTTGAQSKAQIGLVISSAFFGSVLGWMLTQLLASLRRKPAARAEPSGEDDPV
jgi:hypothetical protein